MVAIFAKPSIQEDFKSIRTKASKNSAYVVSLIVGWKSSDK